MKVFTTKHGPLQIKATHLKQANEQILLMDGLKLVGGFPKSSVTHITKHGEAIYTSHQEMEE